MIKKLSINNFRNIEAAEYDLGQTTIISGENGLGKSNTLNALMWLLTDTLLTDKFGSGENQIDSIIPFDFKKKVSILQFQ
ncbi:MAG: AAA family ATPase [Clostridium sp.]|nr:MAG: AAA family ATPase [Clostridium sp.]